MKGKASTSTKLVIGCGALSVTGCIASLCVIAATAPPVPEQQPAAAPAHQAAVADSGVSRVPEPDAGPSWLSRWEEAERRLVDDGDPRPAMELLDAVQPDACDEACETAAGEIEDRIQPWARYATRVDALESEVEGIRSSGQNDIMKWMLLRAALSGPGEAPEACPSTVCTQARERAVARITRSARADMQRGIAAMRRQAVQYRRDKAARMDAALTGTRIDGTIRAEGTNADQLVFRYALCGRPIAESMFLQNLDVFRQEGFRWVGCRASFRRYGWDLEPPPIEEQSVISREAMGLE